jgi:hypothetical protein
MSSTGTTTTCRHHTLLPGGLSTFFAFGPFFEPSGRPRGRFVGSEFIEKGVECEHSCVASVSSYIFKTQLYRWLCPALPLPATPAAIMPSTVQPAADLKLNCLEFGNRSNRVFTVQVAKDATIDALKKIIWNEKRRAFHHVDADALDLWQVRACVFG